MPGCQTSEIYFDSHKYAVGLYREPHVISESQKLFVASFADRRTLIRHLWDWIWLTCGWHGHQGDLDCH